VLVFTKGGRTEHVWFYKVENDGYSLDDKRMPIMENDLPDLVKQWKQRNLQKDTDRTKQCFFVLKEEIAENKYDLSLNRYAEADYDEVVYDPPQTILARWRKLEDEIGKDLNELEVLLG
jgi:type I restriction enzyme M protein